MTTFTTERAAQAAIRAAIEAGKATSGHVSEFWNGGTQLFRAHVSHTGTGWCL